MTVDDLAIRERSTGVAAVLRVVVDGCDVTVWDVVRAGGVCPSRTDDRSADINAGVVVKRAEAATTAAIFDAPIPTVVVATPAVPGSGLVVTSPQIASAIRATDVVVAFHTRATSSRIPSVDSAPASATTGTGSP